MFIIHVRLDLSSAAASSPALNGRTEISSRQYASVGPFDARRATRLENDAVGSASFIEALKGSLANKDASLAAKITDPCYHPQLGDN